jgi:hypothetical protein
MHLEDSNCVCQYAGKPSTVITVSPEGQNCTLLASHRHLKTRKQSHDACIKETIFVTLLEIYLDDP